MDDNIKAANVIACVIGAATAVGPVAGAGAGIATVAALADFIRNLSRRTPALQARIADDLKAELAAWGHLTDAARLLIPQMVQASALTPSEIMAAARQPDRIVSFMLEKLTDPAHRTALIRQQFGDVMIPLFQRLLADQGVNDRLRPAFEDALAVSLRQIGEQVEAMTTQMHATAYKLGVQETLVKELARRYAPGSEGDFNAAVLGLENALQTAATMQRAARLPHNTTDQVDAVLAEVDALNTLGQLDAADAALAAARAEARDRIAEQTSGLMRLLDSTVAQATLRNRPDQAAQALVERLTLDTPPDFFNALRALQDEWYVPGRDKGLAFDLQVSIALAETSVAQAQTPDQRGAALNDLGTALCALGKREPGTARLEGAVAAFAEARKELTRDRVPLNWALTQNNLGAALKTLGEREPDTARLEGAVAAYTGALKEYTRDRVPLNWAATQNNLGAALQTLGEREPGTARLVGAVAAYTEALKERTRDRVPLDWAMTQNNLGTALGALGKREPGTARLEGAVAAYAEALKEYTRDRVPLDWAITQFNLANVEIAWFDKTADAAHLARARDYVMAARQVFVQAGAGHYIGMADEQLANITARQP